MANQKRRKDNKGRVLKEGEYQRKNGTYEYRYKVDGKAHSIYAETLTELRSKSKEVNSKVTMGIKPKGGNITLMEQVKKTVELGGYKKPNTVHHYDTIMTVLSRHEISEMAIEDIKESDVRSFLITLSKEVATDTQTATYLLCHRAIKLALREKLIATDQFNFDYKKLISKTKKPTKALTDKEFDSLMNYMENSGIYSWYIPHLIFLRETGLRISEFCGLTKEVIDFENRKLRIKRQLLVEAHTNKFYIQEAKTEGSCSEIPLTKVAVDALKLIIKRCLAPQECYDRDGKELTTGLFVVTKNQNLFNQKNFYEVLTRLKKSYNLANPDCQIEELRPHVFRHTCATRFMRKGASPAAVQKLLRHKTSKMTMEIYTHLTFDDTMAELDKTYQEAV